MNNASYKQSALRQTLFAILLAFFGLILSLLLCIRPVCVTTIHDVLIADAVKSRVLDAVYKILPDLSADQLQVIAGAVKDNKALDSFTGDYLDALAEAAAKHTAFDPPDTKSYSRFMTKNVIHTIQVKLAVPLTGTMSAQLEAEIEKSADNINRILSGGMTLILNLGGQTITQILTLYNIATSLWIKLVFGALLLIASVFVILSGLRQMRWMKTAGICALIIGFLTGAAAPGVLHLISWRLTNRLLGRTADINVYPLYYAGAAAAGAGILLMLLYIILKKVKAHPKPL